MKHSLRYLEDYCNGYTFKEIAARHGKAHDTVKKIMQSMRYRYGARSMGELVKKWVKGEEMDDRDMGLFVP